MNTELKKENIYMVPGYVLSDALDAIRDQEQIENKIRIDEMPHYIRKISKNDFMENNISLSDTTKIFPSVWERPSAWEDISQLDCSQDNEVVYLSLYHFPEIPWALGLYISASKGTQIEYGHIINNEFTPIGEPELIAHNTIYTKQLPVDEETLVAKITNQNNDSHITYFSYNQITADINGAPITSPYYYQPVVERIGKLPYITTTTATSTTRGFSSCFIERDALHFGEQAKLTTLAGAWANAWKLKVLDIENLNTSNWAVTSLANTWDYCYSLESLDLNQWDTSSWKVTSLAYTWRGCSLLKTLSINNWNTAHWAVTVLTGTWDTCKSLEQLDITNWDTSNWAVTSLQNTWNNCYLLQDLDLTHFNTSNWAVTNFTYTFFNCYSLKKLNLNKWNTTNWAVTTLASSFQGCYNLEDLLINKWNTTNWRVNNLSGLFTNCRSLIEIDLSTWDTANWGPVTNINMFSGARRLQKVNLTNWDKTDFAINSTASAQTFLSFSSCFALKEVIAPGLDLSNCLRPALLYNLFQNCYCLEKVDLSNWKFNPALNTLAGIFQSCYNLRELDLSSWDLTNTQITTIASAWQDCNSLSTLKIGTWDTSKWAVITMSSTWANCYSLKSLDLSSWDVSNWKTTSMASAFAYCYSLENNPIESWDMSKWPLTTVASLFSNCRNLKEICIQLPTDANITTYTTFADGCDKLLKLSVGNAKHTAATYPLAPSAVPLLFDFYPVISSAAQNYSNMPNLSRESILRILNTLPTITVKTTVTFGNNRTKITPTEITIATDKGWTVA